MEVVRRRRVPLEDRRLVLEVQRVWNRWRRFREFLKTRALLGPVRLRGKNEWTRLKRGRACMSFTSSSMKSLAASATFLLPFEAR